MPVKCYPDCHHRLRCLRTQYNNKAPAFTDKPTAIVIFQTRACHPFFNDDPEN